MHIYFLSVWLGDFVAGVANICLHPQQGPRMEVTDWWTMACTSYHGKQSVYLLYVSYQQLSVNYSLE